MGPIHIRQNLRLGDYEDFSDFWKFLQVTFEIVDNIVFISSIAVPCNWETIDIQIPLVLWVARNPISPLQYDITEKYTYNS